MANNINLIAGDGLTCTLSTSNGTLTIGVDSELIKRIEQLEKDLAQLNTKVDAGPSTGDVTGISTSLTALITRVTNIEEAITLKAEWEEADTKPTKLTNDHSKNWVKSIIADTAPKSHKHSVSDLSDLQIGGSAASTDKIHIKY